MAESLTLDKCKEFAIRIVKLYKYLCNEKHEYVMSNYCAVAPPLEQIYRKRSMA